MHKRKLLACLFLLPVLLSACANNEGNPAKAPQANQTIVSFAPAITEVLLDLGAGERLVGVDTYSAAIPGLPENIPGFDMMEPDAEQLLTLNPGMIFTSTLTTFDGQKQPFQPLEDAGVSVLALPTAESLAQIREQIQQIADAIGEGDKGKALIADMQTQMDAIADTAKGYAGPVKSVFFEVADAPVLYSFGSDVFLTEMIELLGAKNCLDAQSGWISVSEEVVIAENPDVILTNESYLPDPVQSILTRPGWEQVAAVASGQVYALDYDASSRANHRVVKAFGEMAAALYPDLYEN